MTTFTPPSSFVIFYHNKSKTWLQGSVFVCKEYKWKSSENNRIKGQFLVRSLPSEHARVLLWLSSHNVMVRPLTPTCYSYCPFIIGVYFIYHLTFGSGNVSGPMSILYFCTRSNYLEVYVRFNISDSCLSLLYFSNSFESKQGRSRESLKWHGDWI